MRTRKIFIHEEGIYEGNLSLPKPNENHSKEVVSLDNPYDCYPEKEPAIKTEAGKFEESNNSQLGEEYKLHSKIDNFSKTDKLEAYAVAAIFEEINNSAVKMNIH